MIIIYDLDGCLSDDRHRLHLLPEGSPADNAAYKDYNDRMALDEPMNKHLWAVAEEGDCARVVITARPAAYFQITQDWLEHNFGGEFHLMMRPEGNMEPSPKLKGDLVRRMMLHGHHIAYAFDDRQDILDAYAALGIPRHTLRKVVYEDAPKKKGKTVPEILRDMADTFQERNAVYGDNYKQVAQLVKVMFPNGVPPELVVTDQWHLFELKLVKLSRFAISNLTHVDSIHDDAVYSAMIESILLENQNG